MNNQFIKQNRNPKPSDKESFKYPTIFILLHYCDQRTFQLWQDSHSSLPSATCSKRTNPRGESCTSITHKQAPEHQVLTVAKESDSFHVSSHLWTWDDCILRFDPQHTDSINIDPLMSLFNREVCERKWCAFLYCSEQDSFLGFTLWNGDLLKTNLD